MAGHIEQIKQKLDIAEYIGRDVDFKRAGRLLKACCPFHDESTPSFMVDPEKQSWHCYGSCQEGGDIFSYVMKKQSVEFGEALRILAEKAGVELPSHYSPEEVNKQKRLYEINTSAQNFYFHILLTSPQADKARAYLKKREVNDKSIADFKLGYAPGDGKSLIKHLKERNFSEKEMLEASLIVKHEQSGNITDRFRDVITFPISDRSGRCVGFGVRIMDEKLIQNGHAKYVNTAQNKLFDKSGLLYALHLAAPHIRRENQAVIMEGYFDVIAAHQAGYQNAIASMGTAVTEKQIELIKKLTNNLVLALDNDNAGREAAQKSAPLENVIDGEIRILHILDGKDPDEFLKTHSAQWPELLKDATPVVDYLIDLEKVKVDLSSAGGKSALSKVMLPTIASMKDGVRQAHYLSKLAALVGVNIQTLQKEMGLVSQNTRRTNNAIESEQKRPAISLTTSPTLQLENYLLCLLAQNTNLIDECEAVDEYFNDTLNRHIYIKIKREYNSDFADSLDEVTKERWQSFVTKEMPQGDAKARLQDCCRRLKQSHLKLREERKGAILASNKEQGADEIEQLKSLGTAEAGELKNMFRERR